MNTANKLRQSLESLDSLPAIPKIAVKILALELDTDEGEHELLNLISTDPVILSKIIGLSNSPLFGTGRIILTLHDAMALLGSKRVKMVALSLSLLSSMTRKQSGLLNVHGLWHHSLAVALTMETLAQLMPQDRRPSADEVYLAGLLHDIGFLVLDYLDPNLSDQFLVRLKSEPKQALEEVEEEMLGISHGELGALLAQHWNLPESIIATLNFHYVLNDKRGAVVRPLVILANLSEKLLPAFGIVDPVPRDISIDEWLSLGIDPVNADVIKTKVQKLALEIAAT